MTWSYTVLIIDYKNCGKLNNYCTVCKEMQTIFVLKIPRKTFFWGTLRTPAEKDFVTP